MDATQPRSLRESGPRQRSGPLRALILMIAMIFPLPLAACGPDASTSTPPPAAPEPEMSASQTSQPLQSAPAALGPAKVSPDAGCSTGWPYRVQVTTSDPAEVPYLNKIVVCQSLLNGWKLTNKSNVVWVFLDSAASTAITVEKPTLSAAVFRARFAAQPIVTPGETVKITGDTTGLEWVIHPELSTTWAAYDHLYKVLQKEGKAAVKAAVTANSPTRKAVWTCTEAVYSTSVSLRDSVFSENYRPEEHIRAGLGIAASTGACARDWSDAAADRAPKVASPPLRWEQVAGNVERALQESGPLGKQTLQLKSIAQTAPGLLARLCSASSRIC